MTRRSLSNKDAREQWLEKTLALLPQGLRILDAGAGELQYKRFCSHLDYVSQDFGQYDGRGDGAGRQTGRWDNSRLDIVSDITSIPEPDGSFDAVMCVEVLEHVPVPIKVIEEFSRLLKPGGKLVLTAPVCSLTHFAPYYFYNGFSRYFYETSLKQAGFEIEELVHNGNYFDFLAQEVKRVKKVAQQYSRINLLDRLKLKILGAILRGQLDRFSRADRGAGELLCFGIHVLASKR